MSDSSEFLEATTKSLSSKRDPWGTLRVCGLDQALKYVNDRLHLSKIRPDPIYNQLRNWQEVRTQTLTLDRYKLEQALRVILNDPDYDLANDLIEGDLVVPPKVPKYLKPYIHESDYPIRLTKNKIILPTYETLTGV